MALVRHDSKEVQFKIVYCGPPSGGKTTNLQYIHRRLDPRLRGDLVSVATDLNRTISFDYLPVHSSDIRGYQTRFQLFTVPGQDVMSSIRENVLAGVDGIVFVADSSPGRYDASISAWEQTCEALKVNALRPDSVPVAFQFNKRDVAGATRPELFDEAFRLRTPSFLSCATTGYQVFATLDYLTALVLKGFHASNVPERSQNSSRVSPAPVETSL